VGDLDEAKQLYEKALEVDPDNAYVIGNYAIFADTKLSDATLAGELYERALRVDPRQPINLRNYAAFVGRQGDIGRARELFERAVVVAPRNGWVYGRYASFVGEIVGDLDEAKQLYEKALEVDPDNAGVIGSYAIFADTNLSDATLAGELYERALRVDPYDPNNLGNYSQHLIIHGAIRHGIDIARELEKRALPVQLRLETLFYLYAHDTASHSPTLSRIAGLIHRGVRSPGWKLDDNVRLAVGQGHRAPDLLAALAAVISAEADAQVLAQFSDWPTKLQ
jgi:Tfp pilus assembly protein PilF